MRKETTIDIYGYKWKVRFVDVSEMEDKMDGHTFYNERLILIRNDLEEITSECVLRHELTHAILCIQGRWLQEHFTQEEMCEFIGFQTPLLNKLVAKVRGKK